MTDCALCKLVDENKTVVYESEKVIALLHPKPAAAGHIVVFPKKHYTILEDVPDFIMPELFTVANKFSIMAFELLQAQGTNIIIQNGIAAGQQSNHFMIHVVPRRQNDNLSLSWQPKQVDPAELEDAEIRLSEASKGIGVFQEETITKTIEAKEEETDDYLARELERIP